MKNFWTIAGCTSAFLAVALGAFGAHALKNKVSPEMLTIYNIAAQYQMYHSLALVLSSLFTFKPQFENWVQISFLIGIILFSGSLYGLALSGQRWLGMITPLGGSLFLLGWLLFAFGVQGK